MSIKQKLYLDALEAEKRCPNVSNIMQIYIIFVQFDLFVTDRPNAKLTIYNLNPFATHHTKSP